MAGSGIPRQTSRCFTALVASLLTAAFVIVALVTPIASAKPGQLDRSFGAGGKVTTAVNFGIGAFWAEAQIHLAEAPDGAIVISGQDRIARYHANGRLDRGFGVNGVVTIGGVEGMLFFVSDLAVDRSGRVVVFGTAVDNSIILEPAGQIVPGRLSPSYATVIRYRSDGVLDTAFGGGDGIVRTDFGISPSPPFEEEDPVVEVTTGAVDRWNRPVLVAGAQIDSSLCTFRSIFRRLDKLVARLTSSGELDLSFGDGDGTVSFHGVNKAPALTFLDGERIELAGLPDSACSDGPSLALIRLIEGSGAPDEAFGMGGTRFYRRGRIPQRIAVDQFGRTLVLVEGSVFRFKVNGNVDRSFGRRGEATVTLPNERSELSDLTVDARGRPLLVGKLEFRGSRPGPRYKANRRWMTVIRLRVDGKPDRRFGRRGWVATRFGRRSDAVGREAFVDRRGRLVVGGAAMGPSLSPTGGFALARVRLGG